MAYYYANLFTALAQEGPAISVLNVSPTRPFFRNYLVPIIHASEWDDFTLGNVLEAYGHVLNRETTDPVLPAASQQIPNLSNVTSIKDMESRWLHQLLRPFLDQGLQAIMGGQNSATVEIYRGKVVHTTKPSSTFCLNSQGGSSEVLVMGAARPAADWVGDGLNNIYHPLSQAAGHGKSGETRYTYVVTESHITCCQIYLLEKALEHGYNAPDRYGIRYREIPLTDSGIDKLTPALALWAMTMMALHPSNRGINTLGNTARLTSWYRFVGSQGQDRFRNALSGRVVDQPPSGSQVIDISSSEP